MYFKNSNFFNSKLNGQKLGFNTPLPDLAFAFVLYFLLSEQFGRILHFFCKNNFIRTQGSFFSQFKNKLRTIPALALGRRTMSQIFN